MDEPELKEAINDYGGMQPPHFAFYVESIRYHCDSAMNSADVVARILEQNVNSRFIDPRAQVVILDHIQNIVTHAASLSKYFWSIRDGKHKLHKKRSQTLRAHFNLSENSALKDKGLRNHIEHLDENLDMYLWEKPLVGYVIPAYAGEEPEGDGVPTHVFRAFYTDKGVFESLGVRYCIQPIVEEIHKIYKLL